MIKHLMIPAALFAVTATTASAFSGDFLRRLDVNLSEQQISALEEAQELRHAGDFRAARERLEEAEISVEDMRTLYEAVHAKHADTRQAIHAAIVANDYDAFVAATQETKLAELIDTPNRFGRFVRAHELRDAGDHEAARTILTGLGFIPRLDMAQQQEFIHQHPRHHGMALE